MDDLLAITGALSDEGRVRALAALFGGELCACQIIELLGLAPSTVSKHMAVLRQAGLVESRKQGRWMYYRLAEDGSPRIVRETLEWLRRELPRRSEIQADAQRLREILETEKEVLCDRQRARSGCCSSAPATRAAVRWLRGGPGPSEPI